MSRTLGAKDRRPRRRRVVFGGRTKYREYGSASFNDRSPWSDVQRVKKRRRYPILRMLISNQGKSDESILGIKSEVLDSLTVKSRTLGAKDKHPRRRRVIAMGHTPGNRPKGPIALGHTLQKRKAWSNSNLTKEKTDRMRAYDRQSHRINKTKNPNRLEVGYQGKVVGHIVKKADGFHAVHKGTGKAIGKAQPKASSAGKLLMQYHKKMVRSKGKFS